MSKILTSIKPIQYSTLAKTLNYFKNPNAQGGTLLIELPADMGKASNGYKRGGLLEASEILRKELLSAIVWLFGIPLFNHAGNALFEKLAKLPMDIDYDEKTIKNVVECLKNSAEELPEEISKYGIEYINKINSLGIEKSIKRIKGAKQFITIGAWALNCFLMGVALPKINHKITANKLKKEAPKEDTSKRISMEQFQHETKKDSNVSFKGLIDKAVYAMNTNNTVRLISTDVPMIIGRCATSRNKYEALEITLMDSGAIFFYNFCLGLVEKLLSKTFKTPTINPKVAEYIAQQKDVLNSAIESSNKEETFDVKNFFKESMDEIYEIATNGRYGKINRFVDQKEIEEIDESISNFIKQIAKTPGILNEQGLDENILRKTIKNLNIKNTGFYGAGVVASFLGIGWILPKLTYFITKKVSGKSGFIGIEGNDSK